MTRNDRTVAVQNQPTTALTSAEVRDELDNLRPMLEEALPKHMDLDRFLRVVTGALLRNPDILRCDRLSIFQAVMEAGQLGLEPTGLLGSAYIVPYGKKAQLIPGYRGLIDLARRSEQVEAVWAHTIRAKDAFELRLGTYPEVVHVPFLAPSVTDPNDPEQLKAADPGPYTGAYMVAVLRDRAGQPSIRQAEYMSLVEIEAVRTRSRASNGGPWVTDWSEMARKTVVRRGAKYLPLTPEAVRGFSLDEIAERDAEERPATPRDTPRGRMVRTLAQRRGIVAGSSDNPSGEAADGDGSASVDPADESTAICGNVMAPPLGDGETCGLPAGHDGPHKDDGGSVWPQG